MDGYRLSAKADADLADIYEYTILNFGLEQAQTYLAGLHERLRTVAAHPTSGRDAGDLAPGLRRIEYGSHIVFYFRRTDGVHIIRVLHHSMDARRHL